MVMTPHSRKTRTGALLPALAGLLLMLLTGTAAQANSNILNAFNGKYPTAVECQNCHQQGSGGVGLSNDGEYANRLYTALGSPATVGSLTQTFVQSKMTEIESYFAGEVSTLQALDASNTVISTVTSPDGNLTLPANTEKLRVTFGLTTRPFLTSPSTVDGMAVEPHDIDNPGFTSNSGLPITGSNNVFTVTLPSLESRRAARQASAFPYQLDFDPTTSWSFRNIDGLDATNSFNVQTANIPPTAVNDSFNPVLSEVQDSGGAPIPYALNVLSQGRDNDPDHAAASLSVTPANPTLSAAYGSVTRNAGGDGYVYTAPAVLDATPRTVTFTYQAVDEENATSTGAATVTITVPAAAPPPPPKVFAANDDLFTLNEGGSLTNADVKLDNGNGADDLDGALLSEVTFTSDSVSAGSLTFRADGTFDYTPDANFTGDATFVYRISDGSSFDDGTVTLRVDAVNDAPEAVPFVLVSRNETQDAFTEDLLNPVKVSDPDGDPLTISNVVFQITTRPASAIDNFDQSGAFSLDGTNLTIDPAAFAGLNNDELPGLDNDEFADITVTYEISDGAAPPVTNTLSVTIVGLDNGLGRQAGAYANTLSARYASAAFGSHFKGQADAPAACLTCHATIASIAADVDSVSECEQTPPVFTQYGLDICLNRNPDQPALSDLQRRLRQAEEVYGPSMNPVGTIQIRQSAAPGDPVGAPMSVASAGRNVFGLSTQIVTYLIGQGETDVPAVTDPTGQFRIDDSGQITVASGLTAGTYTIVVLPVNDAGQRDNNANPVRLPGFFKQDPGSDSFVTIEVLPDLPTPVDDLANVLTGQGVSLAVLDNDTGGAATQVSIETAPTNGTAVVNGDLTITYTANEGFTGTDSFTYRSRNGAGVSDSVGTVTITVLSGDALLARDDAVTAIEGRTTEIAVLENDGNVRAGSTVTIVSGPDPATEGTATVAGQLISFTPVRGFSGTTSLTYRAENPTSSGPQGSQAIVTITVIALGNGEISAALTDPELVKVAQSLEQSCAIASRQGQLSGEAGQFLDVCAALTVAAVQNEDLTQAMEALRNEEHFAAVDATMTVARGLGRVVSRRLTQIRDGGARGFNTDGVTLRIGDQTVPSGFVAQAARAFMGLGTDGADNPDWGLFIAGDIAWVDRESSTGSQGYELEAGNLMIGYDQQLSALRSVGVALGYSETETEFGDGSSLSSDGFQATFYGVQKDFLRRDLTLEGYMSVGRMNFRSDRRIRFSNGGRTVDTTASADFDGTYINLAPTLSYSRVLGDYGDPIGAPRTATRVTWSAGLDYLWMDLDDYAETGGAGLSLNTESESYDSLILSVGVDASRPVFLGPGTRAELYGGLSIRGELLDKDRSVSSAFNAAGAGSPRFLVTEEGTNGLGAGFELGMLIGFGGGGQLDVNYGYDYAGGGVRTQHLGLGFSSEVFGRDSLSLNVTRSFGGITAGGTKAEVDYGFRF